MGWRSVGTAQCVEHTAGRGADIGVGVVVIRQLRDSAAIRIDREDRASTVLVGGDDQRRTVVRPRHRRRPAIPVQRHVDRRLTEAQAAQCDSWRHLRCRVRLAGVGDRGAVWCDRRAPQVGAGIVGDHGPLAAFGVDAHQHDVLGSAGGRLLPAGDHEPAVGADVEVASRNALPGDSVRSRGAPPSRTVPQMRLAGPEILVPVPDRVAGVQDRGDLGVLTQIP